MSTPNRPGRVAGALVTRYAMDVPADPGASQPWRHREDAPGGGVDRDDAPQGGGWQPDSWGTLEPAGPVLDGAPDADVPTHHGTGSHVGPRGRGLGKRSVDLDSLDANNGGLHGRATLDDAGSAGAANGGLVSTGVSAAWANAPVVRRRADGGLVANPGGLDLGSTYVRVAARHRQGLHFNRPTLRFIRLFTPMNSSRDASASPGGASSPFISNAPLRTAGPVAPRLRRLIRPYGQTDYVPEDQAPGDAGAINPGPIGGDWVQ